jgi:hypothetical protein
MADTQIIAVPELENGDAITSGAGAWGYGSWVVLSPGTTAVTVYGVAFQNTDVPAIDVTQEFLIELGVGAPGAEVVKIQIPYSFRQDTNVGYYLDARFFLPEPWKVPYGVVISARVADSIAAALLYNGVKLFGMRDDTPSIGFNNYLFVRSGNMSAGERII